MSSFRVRVHSQTTLKAVNTSVVRACDRRSCFFAGMDAWLMTQDMTGPSEFAKTKLYKPGICLQSLGFQNFMTCPLTSRNKIKYFLLVPDLSLSSNLNPQVIQVRV